jgi:nucleotide-binding universal stress UspA family protein
MPLSRILVPVDFSERSKGAVCYAAALQKLFGSRVTLLQVLPPPQFDFGAMEVAGVVLEQQLRYRAEQARADLERFMSDALPQEMTVRKVIDGDPATSIIEEAREQNVGLIVMPTHGYGPFRRFILGSVTAKVLHDADCPVWTGVHLEASSPGAVHLRHITAAIDLGAQSERTLMWAARLAQASGAKLAVVHAMPACEGPVGEQADAGWRKQVEAAVRDEAIKLFTRLELDVPLHIESGEPARAVCDVAADLQSDLLVIGRGAAAGVFGLLRANAYAIIRQSQCPVVSV